MRSLLTVARASAVVGRDARAVDCRRGGGDIAGIGREVAEGAGV